MKIFDFLAILSKEELKLLRKAVQSPLYNTNPMVVRLFEVLRPMHPNFDDSLKARKKLFKKLFPKATYNDYKLRWHFLELTKVIEKLLLFIEQEKDTFGKQKKLATIYKQRNLPTYFKKSVAALLLQLSKNTLQSPDRSLEELSLLEMKYFHPLHNKHDLADPTLKKANEQLDIFFALKKYRLAIALKSREQILQEQHNYKFLEAVKNEVEEGFLNNHALLNLYQQAIAVVELGTVSSFAVYEQAFLANYSLFHFTDQKFLYFTGINFLVKEYNKPNSTIKYKVVDWYKLGLNTKMIFKNQKITENTFANIIICGCKAGQFDWVEHFIDTYQKQLATSNLAVTVLYYQGIFYFLKKDYDRALAILLKSDKKSIYPPRLRTILARILFEKFMLDTSFFDALQASLTTYEYALKRNKSVALTKLKAHQNFIIVLRYFARKRLFGAKKETMQAWFHDFLEKDNPLLAKAWLEQKIEQF